MTALRQDPFVLVTPEQAKLRMFLMGPSGSGKTWTALEIATRLASKGNGKVAFLDTEGKSCKKYASYFRFSAMFIKDFSPNNYIQAIRAATEFGYEVLVIDSFTHAWNGRGGVLEIVDRSAEKMGNNKFAGWKDGRPAHNALIDALVNAEIHIIGTARSKTEWTLETQANGRTKPVKVGLAAVQDSEFEYEFDIAGTLDMEHRLTITKSRCRDIAIDSAGNDWDGLSDTLNTWLSTGAPPPPSNKVTDIETARQTLGSGSVERRAPFDVPKTNGSAALQPDPVALNAWASKDTIAEFGFDVRDATGVEDMTQATIARLGLQDEDKFFTYKAWNETYATKQAAIDAIKAAFEAEMTAKPAAIKETPSAVETELFPPTTDISKRL